jgi:hypothetical protein
MSNDFSSSLDLSKLRSITKQVANVQCSGQMNDPAGLSEPEALYAAPISLVRQGLSYCLD